MARHEIGLHESGHRCQLVAVYSLSNPKRFRSIDTHLKCRRCVVDFGKGIWHPAANVGGTLRTHRWGPWEHIVLDGHCYEVLDMNDLRTKDGKGKKKRAFYLISESDERKAKKACGIFFDTLGKVMEGSHGRT